jgi:hypothetical protein
MPVLTVLGLSASNKLAEFSEALKVAVSESAEELKLKPSGVSCYFPQDLLPRNNEEILIFVDCLTEKPERTDEVRKKLAEALVAQAKVFYPNAKLVECFVKPFKTSHGFASYIK